jgi:phosphatidylserine/phosphatidylglycerophosphate/cardiolipin synthase-like enzyme
MRASLTKNGLTVRVIAGTTNVIIGMDLEAKKRAGCLGFSIRRVDFDPGGQKIAERWLPNMLKFPSDANAGKIDTSTAPLQKFRWGDYTCDPGHKYRYQVIPRYGKPGQLLPELLNDSEGVTVEVTTEDNAKKDTAVFFNRGAAASKAFDDKFPGLKDVGGDTDQAAAARKWLSRGLEEAIVNFIDQAKNQDFALHCAIYEFQKPELLEALKRAKEQRKVDVQVVYHHRTKGDEDRTAQKNDQAIAKALLPKDILIPRKAAPQSAIMHNKFLTLLEKQNGKFHPVAVWTGSTNWTEGAIYGQLNVGHAIYEPEVAEIYEAYFQLLKADTGTLAMKQGVDSLTPVSLLTKPKHGVTPIFSPQSTDAMLHLYSNICRNAKCVLISAPFALSPILLAAFTTTPTQGSMRYFLLDKEGSLGKGQEVQVIEADPNNSIGVATTLPSALHDFQGKLLEGKKESFHHAGIHIHSKIIAVDPFGADPIIVTGSANFSNNSTEVNDSNSIVIRGETAVADIYTTEFMRMFEHYHFRASQAAAEKKKPAGKDGTVISLKENDSWSDSYYAPGSTRENDRRLFAGTLQ